MTICALPKRVTAVSQNRPGSLSVASFLPDRLGRDRALDEADLAGRVDPVVRLSSLGSSRRSTWSVVHATVATVGMPSRW